MKINVKVLLMGYGYTTSYILNHFEKYEYRILSRSFDKLSPSKDFEPDIVIDSIPPVYEENRLLNPLYYDLLSNFWNRKKFVYVHISSTSVYSEREGTFNEMSPINNLNERGKKRWNLENQILKFFPYALIIRAGGIYGPKRNLIESIKNQNYSKIPREDKIVHRIHVFDLCNLILEAAKLLLEKKIEVSLFPGYERMNLMNAVEPEAYPISFVLDFIKKQWNIHHNITVLSSNSYRTIKSNYADKIIKFKYPNFIEGFSNV